MSKITVSLTTDQIREIQSLLHHEIYESKEFVKKYGPDKNERDRQAFVKRIQTALTKATSQE